MAFIRKRGNSNQLIETHREAGKVRQRTVANLGPHSDPEKAVNDWGQWVYQMQQELGVLEQALEDAEARGWTSTRLGWKPGSKKVFAEETLTLEVLGVRNVTTRRLRQEVERRRKRLKREIDNLDALTAVVSK